MSVQPEKLMSKPEKLRILGPCSLEFESANTGSWRIERPKVDAESCIRCGTCSRYCPADCILIHKEGDTPVEIDWRYCKGCGICSNECPKTCIEMVNERGEA